MIQNVINKLMRNVQIDTVRKDSVLFCIENYTKCSEQFFEEDRRLRKVLSLAQIVIARLKLFFTLEKSRKM